MSTGVEFDEDKFSYGGRPKYQAAPGGYTAYNTGGGQGSGMAGWLVRKGWAKTPAAAQGMLVVLIIVNIIVTYFVITYFIV